MPYAYRLLKYLAGRRIPVELVISDPAWDVIRQELPAEAQEIEDREKWVRRHFGSTTRLWANTNWSSPIASGSAPSAGMVIIPCSMGTLGRIAAGISSSLLERGADVCLKEGRRLVLVTRETPLNLIHLENMARLVKAGATVLPAAPAFYHNPQSISDLVDFIVGRVLYQLGIENDLVKSWGSK
ncbi:MAG: UbiX family flavin prenyltransferase [Firmicutes bacterium]|nr:UbiX family flavin prenyltransferase [Bacillota bacterium]